MTKRPAVKVIALAILVGLAAWAGEAAVDCLFLRKGSFPEMLIADITVQHVLERGVATLGLLMFGVCVSRIVTKHSRAEETLRKSEKRLQRLLDTMAEGVVLMSPNGHIIQANPAAERILGGRDHLETGWEILRADGTPMPPEERAGFCATKERRQVGGLTTGIRRPDGATSWVSVTAAPFIDEAGQFEGILCTFTDVNVLKLAEGASCQHAAEPERFGEDLNAFANTIAHDLNVRLNLVIGCAEIFQCRYAALLDENARDLIQKIIQNALEMSNVVYRLLLLVDVCKADMVGLDQHTDHIRFDIQKPGPNRTSGC